MSNDVQVTTRTVWRQKLHPGQVTKFHVGLDPRVVAVDTDLSGDVAVWVEHTPIPMPEGMPQPETLRFLPVSTGANVPEGGEHIGMVKVRGLGGRSIVHVYRLS